MQNENSTPLAWVSAIAHALQWPAIVASAFWLGRKVERLQNRILSAEGNLKALIDRHLPHVHRALADLKGKLETIQALLTKGK